MVPRRSQKGSRRYQVLNYVINPFKKADMTLSFVYIAGPREVGAVALGARNAEGRESPRNRSGKSLRTSGSVGVDTADRVYALEHLVVLYEYKKVLEIQLHFVQDFAFYPGPASYCAAEQPPLPLEFRAFAHRFLVV